MKAFYDTSILLAAAREDDERHEASIRLLAAALPHRDGTALHCLAEFYATITRLPPGFRVTPRRAEQMIEGFRGQLTLVSLTERDYLLTVEEITAKGIVGGAIYDALIARCALKFAATRLYTWNTKHFSRFSPELARITREPD